MKTRFALYGALAVVAVLAATVMAPDAYAAFVHSAPAAFLAVGAAGAFGIVGDIQLVTSKTLRENRAQLVDAQRKLLDKIGAEKDQARVKELETEFDRRDADIVTLTSQIARAEKVEALEAEGTQPAQERRSGRHQPEQPGAKPAEQQEAYRAAFWSMLRFGMDALTPEARQSLRSGYASINGPVHNVATNAAEQRALSTTVAAGGYTIPEGFFPKLQENLLAFGGVREIADVFTTATGNTIPMPTEDDTTQKAQIVGEGSALTSPQDTTFGVINLGAYTYRSLVLASIELLQDTSFVTEDWIRGKLTMRVARGTNVHFTTGNGSTQPQGAVAVAASGATAAAATSVSYNDLVNLEHSIDPAYRRGPKVGFMFNDGTLKVIKKLVDSQNRPLWLPGMAVREPDTILGYRYVINQDMAGVQASNKSVAFGDWSKYMIRDVSSLLIVRANELHIANGQIGFYVFSRHDGKLIDAGTDPIKVLTHPSPD